MWVKINWTKYFNILQYFIIPYKTNKNHINDVISYIIRNLNVHSKRKTATLRGNTEMIMSKTRVLLIIILFIIVNIFYKNIDLFPFNYFKKYKVTEILIFTYIIMSMGLAIYFSQTHKLISFYNKDTNRENTKLYTDFVLNNRNELIEFHKNIHLSD